MALRLYILYTNMGSVRYMQKSASSWVQGCSQQSAGSSVAPVPAGFSGIFFLGTRGDSASLQRFFKGNVSRFRKKPWNENYNSVFGLDHIHDAS